MDSVAWMDKWGQQVRLPLQSPKPAAWQTGSMWNHQNWTAGSSCQYRTSNTGAQRPQSDQRLSSDWHARTTSCRQKPAGVTNSNYWRFNGNYQRGNPARNEAQQGCPQNSAQGLDNIRVFKNVTVQNANTTAAYSFHHQQQSHPVTPSFMAHTPNQTHHCTQDRSPTSARPPDYFSAVSQSHRNVTRNSSSAQQTSWRQRTQPHQALVSSNGWYDNSGSTRTDRLPLDSSAETRAIAKIAEDLRNSVSAASNGHPAARWGNPRVAQSQVRRSETSHHTQPVASNSNNSQHAPLCSAQSSPDSTHSRAARYSYNSQHAPLCSAQSSPDSTHSRAARYSYSSQHAPLCSAQSSPDSTHSRATSYYYNSQHAPLCSAQSSPDSTHSRAARSSKVANADIRDSYRSPVQTSSDASGPENSPPIVNALLRGQATGGSVHFSPGCVGSRAVAVVQPLLQSCHRDQNSSPNMSPSEHAAMDELFCRNRANVSPEKSKQTLTDKSKTSDPSASCELVLNPAGTLTQNQPAEPEPAADIQVPQHVIPAPQEPAAEGPNSQSRDQDGNVNPADPPESYVELSSIPTIQCTLGKMKTFIHELNTEKMDVIRKSSSCSSVSTLIEMFWNNDTNISIQSLQEHRHWEIPSVAEDFLMKHVRNDTVIVSGVKQENWKALERHRILKHDEVYSEPPYQPFWLTFNEKLDNIEKEFGLPWSLRRRPSILERDFQQDQAQIVDSISEEILREVSEMVVAPAEREPVHFSRGKPSCTDKTAALKESSDPVSALEITVWPVEEARLLFEQAQMSAKGQLERETDAKGQLERETDAKGQLERETSAKGQLERETGAKGQLERETGAKGQLERETGAKGQLERETGAKGQLERETGAKGQLERETDAEGQLERQTGAKGQLERETGAKGQLERETGAKGQLERETGAKGQLERETGAKGQLERETGAKGQLERETGAKGQLERETSAKGQLERETSAKGQLERETGAKGQLERETGAKGQLERETGAKGQLERETGAKGQLERETSAKGQLERETGAKGQLERETSAKGQLERETSAKGQLERETGAKGQLERETGAKGQLERETGAKGQLERETGAKGQLERETSAKGQLERERSRNEPQRERSILSEAELQEMLNQTLRDLEQELEAVSPAEQVCCMDRLKVMMHGPSTALSSCRCQGEKNPQEDYETCDEEGELKIDELNQTSLEGKSGSMEGEHPAEGGESCKTQTIVFVETVDSLENGETNNFQEVINCSQSSEAHISEDMDHGPLDHGPLDHGLLDDGPLDHGLLDDGPLDDGPLDDGPLDHGPLDDGLLDHGPLDDGPLDHGPLDHGLLDDGPLGCENRAPEPQVDDGDLCSDTEALRSLKTGELVGRRTSPPAVERKQKGLQDHGGSLNRSVKPLVQDALSEKKMRLDDMVKYGTAKLALFGSSQHARSLTFGKMNQGFASGAESRTISEPPKVLSVSLSPSKRNFSDTLAQEEPSAKQRIYEKWRESLPPSQIPYKKFKPVKFQSSSAVSLKKPDRTGGLERPLSPEKRIYNVQVITASEKLPSDRLRHGNGKNKRGRKRLAENQTDKAQRENIILKFSVLPETFSFRNEPQSTKSTTPPKPNTTEHAGRKSVNTTVTSEKGTWSKQSEPKYCPLDRKTSSVFQEFQKKYKEALAAGQP